MHYLEMAKRAMAQQEAGAPTAPLEATAVWSAALDLLAADPEPGFSLEEIAILRTAEVRWVEDQPNSAPESAGSLEVLPDWPAPPCSTCGSLEHWQDLADRWRCRHCDPPTSARRLRRLAERIRQRGTG